MIGYALFLSALVTGLLSETDQQGIPALASVQTIVRWASMPNQKQLREAVPDSIHQRVAVTMSCSVNSEGALYECKSVEGAISRDLDIAAMKLTRFYKLPTEVVQASLLPARVNFVIIFLEDVQGQSLPNGPCVAPGCVAEPSIEQKN